MNIYQDAANNTEEVHNGERSDQRLWTAVLLQAIEDWKSANVRRSAEAEKFLFQSKQDFARVCQGAGLASENVAKHLRRMKETMPRRLVLQFQQAA